MNEKFEWKEATSCPIGYPVDVYRGGLESSGGGFTSLYSGTTIGSWGESNDGMSNGLKTLPDHLHVVWLSYAEDSFYEIDTDIDKVKMVELFRQGYYTPSMDRSRPEPFKENYYAVTVGFAPGGVVVIWVSGSGRQIEIGRYQGKKITIPKEHSDQLEPGPSKNMFDPEYRKWIMQNKSIVPLEIQEAHKGKPIPYGLWDSYRKRYKWKTSFILPNEGVLDELIITTYGGEYEILFGDYLLKNYSVWEELKWNTPTQRAIPNRLKFSWFNKEGVLLVAEIKFNEEEIFRVFQEVYQENPEVEAELQIRINQMQSDASVKLIGNGKEVGLTNNEIKVYDTSKY